MLKAKKQKNIAIIAGSLFFIICALLLIFKVVTIYILWAILFILPLLLMVDFCFVALPIAVPVFFAMACNTLITKNYEKFNNIYEILTIIITVGIINSEIDNILNNRIYVVQTNCLKVYWLAYLGVALICGCMFVSKKKDTRLYLLIYGVLIVFYLLYKIIESFE